MQKSWKRIVKINQNDMRFEKTKLENSQPINVEQIDNKYNEKLFNK